MKTLKRTLLIKLLLILPFTLIIQLYTESGRLSSRELKEEAWKFPKKDTLSLETLGSTKVFISGSNYMDIEIKLKYRAKPDGERYRDTVIAQAGDRNHGLILHLVI